MTAFRRELDGRTAALLAVVLIGAGVFSGPACHLGIPSFGSNPGVANPKATISGTIRDSAGVALAERRTIRVFDVKTGRRYTTRTNTAGGYTFFVPPGVYRFEFPLSPGETLVQQPDPIEVGPAGIRADVDLVLARASGNAR